MISYLTLRVKLDYLQTSKERLKVEILTNWKTPKNFSSTNTHF